MPTQKPLLSIIIPVYNEAEYIHTCLRALETQIQSTRDECIVVDNNCTDDSPTIAARFPFVRVAHEKIPGASAARNHGATVAKGTYLVFIDADCVPPPDHLQHIVSLVKKHPHSDAFAGPYTHYDGPEFVRFATNTLRYYAHYFHAVRLITGMQTAASGNVVYKVSSFRSIGGFQPSLNDVLMAEDVELSLRMHHHAMKTYFDDNLLMPTSYRRMMRAPFKTAIVRSLYLLKYLIAARFPAQSNKQTTQ